MYNKDEYQIDEGKSAKFNASVLGTQRINKHLDLLNQCNTNLAAYNDEFSDWNFNIAFAQIKILYNEIDSLLSKKEREICLQMKKKIEEMMKKYNIVEEVKRLGKNVGGINQNNLKIISAALDSYERVVRRYGTKYQIITQTIDTDLEGF